MTTEPVAALAAYRLSDEPIDVASWDRLVADAERHGLIGLLAAAVDDGVLAPDEQQRVELEAQHEAYMVAAMALERTLLEVDVLVADAAVPTRVLKGPALAHGVALDPSHRTFGDIDLLVPGEHIDRAISILLAAGAERPSPELAPGYDRRFAKSVTLVWGAHEIDLHRTLAPGPFGVWVDQASLWAEGSAFTLADRKLATLDRERHLVHACYHAVLGDVEPRLSSLRDIALLAADPDLDEQQVRSLALGWRGEAVVAAGLGMTAERLPGRAGPLFEWADRCEPPADQQRALSSYRTEHRRFARQSLATLRALDGWGDRLAFGRAVAWPSRAHLDARGLTRWRHLVRR